MRFILDMLNLGCV